MRRALAAIDLGFSYAGRAVLRGANLAVKSGQVTVLVGPSGSGKTTLLWLMAGLLEPAGGRIALADGENLMPVRFPLKGLGMVFQQPGLWEHLTAQEHLELVLRALRLDRGQRRRRIGAVLARMRLEPLRRRRPGRMSGGERQRLAIARAVVIEPQWLLLDEPLAHLDGPARSELLELLREAMAGTRAGVLMSTHDPHEAMRLADQIAILLDGAIAQRGPPREVYSRPVSLPAALTLGPASEVSGQARSGRLLAQDRAILEEIDPMLRGPTRMILRPEDLEFRADPAGPAVVRRCEWTAGVHYLLVEAAGAVVTVRHHESVKPGAAGRLRLLGGARALESPPLPAATSPGIK